MKRLVCFGEIMLRLSTPGNQRFLQARSFDATYGGAEANVAVAAAGFGLEARYVTKLPENLLGDAARNELRRFGVDTSCIARGGDRLGTYYLETGASMRPSNVIYDRAGSAIACASPGDFDWDRILDGADWFHFTGITPALGGNMEAITLEACQKARDRGITVSCDVNYRKKLWSIEKATDVMSRLFDYVDVAINPADVVPVDTDKPFSVERCQKMAKYLEQRHNIKTTAFTIRESISASDNGWSAMLYEGGRFYHSKHYDIRIVDRVGGGDSFSAGLIYGLTAGMGAQNALEFAVAASALKHTITGDYNLASVQEITTLMGGDGTGRVQR